MWPWIEVIGGLVLIVFSAERFIEGAANTARHLGMPTLLIGMFIVGFGTSAPELLVSGIAASQGNQGLSLGNGIGSNITNVGLILGLTALLQPIQVHSKIVRQEIPLLLAATSVLASLLWDNELSRMDAAVLLVTFVGFSAWSITQSLKVRSDELAKDVDRELESHRLPLGKAIFWLTVGLVLLVLSSRIFVDGAVSIANALGVSDVVIGLTIVAFGTSLPELAASIIAVRKNEHDIALGNVIGSNIFNALVVTGIAGTIRPIQIHAEVWSRDVMMMVGLTVLLLVFSYGFRGQGRINRREGGILLIAFIIYTWKMAQQALGH